MTQQDVVIEQGDWATLGECAAEIRRQVFIEEQAVSLNDEWDGRDPECLHFLAWCQNRPLGTARLLPDGHLGRVAVIAQARGKGIGLHLMRAAISAARQRNHRKIILDAQLHALPFYERLGFQAFGSEFYDAGILHRSMQLLLSD